MDTNSLSSAINAVSGAPTTVPPINLQQTLTTQPIQTQALPILNQTQPIQQQVSTLPPPQTLGHLVDPNGTQQETNVNHLKNLLISGKFTATDTCKVLALDQDRVFDSLSIVAETTGRGGNKLLDPTGCDVSSFLHHTNLRETQLRAKNDNAFLAAQELYRAITGVLARAPRELADARDAPLWKAMAASIRLRAAGAQHYITDDMLNPLMAEVLAMVLRCESRLDTYSAEIANLKAQLYRQPQGASGNCHQCGRPGHRIQECKEALAILAAGGELKVPCRVCKKKTHFTKNCEGQQAAKK